MKRITLLLLAAVAAFACSSATTSPNHTPVSDVAVPMYDYQIKVSPGYFHYSANGETLKVAVYVRRAPAGQGWGFVDPVANATLTVQTKSTDSLTPIPLVTGSTGAVQFKWLVRYYPDGQVDTTEAQTGCPTCGEDTVYIGYNPPDAAAPAVLMLHGGKYQ